MADIASKERVSEFDPDVRTNFAEHLHGLAFNYAEWECLAYRGCGMAPTTTHQDRLVYARRGISRMREICDRLKRDFPNAQQCE